MLGSQLLKSRHCETHAQCRVSINSLPSLPRAPPLLFMHVGFGASRGPPKLIRAPSPPFAPPVPSPALPSSLQPSSLSSTRACGSTWSRCRNQSCNSCVLTSMCMLPSPWKPTKMMLRGTGMWIASTGCRPRNSATWGEVRKAWGRGGGGGAMWEVRYAWRGVWGASAAWDR